MDTYLHELGSDEQRAKDLLRALAYGEGEGLPGWRNMDMHCDRAVRRWNEISERDLRWLLSSPAADLIQARRSAADGDEPVFRLFHAALIEYLRSPDHERDAQALLTGALLKLGSR